MSRRRLPPLVSDADRIKATHIAADQLYAELRQAELLRALWSSQAPRFNHWIDSNGTVFSERA